MHDTLGLLEEARQLAGELGYVVTEEPLGDLSGGPCIVAGERRIMLNLEQGPVDRLDVLVRAIAADPRVHREPKSRLLAKRLAAVGGDQR